MCLSWDSGHLGTRPAHLSKDVSNVILDASREHRWNAMIAFKNAILYYDSSLLNEPEIRVSCD